jgi:outer membrane protein assembly factor BamA
MLVVFQSTSAIRIASIAFDGCTAVDQDELKRKMLNAVVGQPYSERDLREALRANVTPMYEAVGYLRVSYPKIMRTLPGANQAAVLVTIDEGKPWRAGALELTGDSLPAKEMGKVAEFPTGQIASWPLMVASVTRAERVLRSQGYLQVSADPVRQFHDETGIVDLHVAIVRGPQFVLGDLRFEGLSPDEADIVGRRFGLRPGAPVDEPYIETYTSQIQRILGAKARKMERRFVTRTDNHTVDVVFKIG